MLVQFSKAAMAAVTLAALALAGTGPAMAGSAFDDIRPAVFGNRAILDGHGMVSIKAPVRPEDIRAVPFEADVKLPAGRTIRSITFIIDNNPSPVAAAFRLGPGRDHANFKIHFRLNQQSDIRAVVEANDGKLYMVTQLMKFPGGQAACSAPPATPPDQIVANMGKMTLDQVEGEGAAASTLTPRVRYGLAHPNHTGMVLDQITLLYTPLKMVERLTARLGDEIVFEMDGSIALNENPVIEFDYKRNGSSQLTMTVRDTDGAEFTKAFDIGAGS